MAKHANYCQTCGKEITRKARLCRRCHGVAQAARERAKAREAASPPQPMKEAA